MRTKKPRTEKPAPTPAPAAPPPPAPPAAPSIDTFVQPLTPAEVASLQAALARGPIPGVVPAGLVTAARKAIARGDLVWQKDQAGDGGTWVAATELLRSSMGEGVFPEAPAMVRAQPVRSPVAAPVAPSVAPVVPGPVVASQALRALIAREGRGGLTLERAIDEASVMREKLEAERGVHPLHTWAAFEREREALASLEVRLRDLVAREAPASAVAAAAPSVQERVRENIENALRGRIVWFERPGDARKMRTVKIGDEGWLVETYAANGEIVSSDRASRLGEVVGALVAAGHIIPSGGVAAPAPAPVAAPTAPAPSPPSPVVFPLSALLPPRESYREDTDRGILIYVGPGELGMDDKGKPRIFTYARWVEAPPEVGGHAVFVPKGKAGGADVRLVSPAGKLVVAFDGPKKDGTFEAFLHAGFSRGLDGRVKKNTWQGHTRDPIMAGYEFLRDVLAAARAILVPVPPTYCLSLVRSGLALRDAAVLFDPVVTGLEGAVSMTTPTREIEIAWDNRGVRADLYELRLQRDVRRRHAITSLTLTSPSEIPEAVLLLSRK